VKLPIAKEGVPFVAVPGALALGLFVLGRRRAAAPFALAALASLGFFRDPERAIPPGPDLVLAPADGRVTDIVRVQDPFVGDAFRISIFLSPLDVHVNRAPIAALVVARQFVPGRFLAAFKADASEVNERCVLHLQGAKARVAVTQIAGVLARRIVCRVAPGDKLEAGERFGLIRFGSRTDLTVPRDTDVRVRVGEQVTGGESVMGVTA
jgi:phosphatidylserine decarboxylase